MTLKLCMCWYWQLSDININFTIFFCAYVGIIININSPKRFPGELVFSAIRQSLILWRNATLYKRQSLIFPRHCKYHTWKKKLINKSSDSVRRRSILMKLEGLITMFWNYTQSDVWKEIFSDTFPTQNDPKQGQALSQLLVNFPLEMSRKRTNIN